MALSIILRKLPSHHGEISIMKRPRSIIKHGDSNSDVLICFDTKFNLSVSYIF